MGLADLKVGAFMQRRPQKHRLKPMLRNLGERLRDSRSCLAREATAGTVLRVGASMLGHDVSCPYARTAAGLKNRRPISGHFLEEFRWATSKLRYCWRAWGSAPTRRRPLTKTVGVLRTSRSLAVGEAAVHLGGGLRAGHAGFEGLGIETGSGGIVEHFLVGVGGGDEVLVVVDQVVDLPEGLGVLLVGAASGEGGGSGPGMD